MPNSLSLTELQYQGSGEADRSFITCPRNCLSIGLKFSVCAQHEHKHLYCALYLTAEIPEQVDALGSVQHHTRC